LAEDLKAEVFEEKVKIVNEAFSEETSLLSKLLNERNGGAKVEEKDGAPVSSPRAKKSGKSDKSEKSEKSEKTKK